MILGSLLGFVIGIALCFVFVRYVFGGLVHTTLRMLYDGTDVSSIRGGEESATQWSRLTCLAHAFLLDQLGYCDAAGMLLTMVPSAAANPSRHLGITRRQGQYLLAKYERHRRQGNLIYYRGEHEPPMFCEKHGESRWLGHVRCLQCNRKYAPIGSTTPPPSICECGHRLMPARTDRGEMLPSSATMVCRHCFPEPDSIVPVTRPDPAEQWTPIAMMPALLQWGGCPQCDTVVYLRFGSEYAGPPLRDPPSMCPACGHTFDDEHEHAEPHGQ